MYAMTMEPFTAAFVLSLFAILIALAALLIVLSIRARRVTPFYSRSDADAEEFFAQFDETA